jgi:hypothetical protein
LLFLKFYYLDQKLHHFIQNWELEQPAENTEPAAEQKEEKLHFFSRSLLLQGCLRLTVNFPGLSAALFKKSIAFAYNTNKRVHVSLH